MTNEEAIKIVERIHGWLRGCDSDEGEAMRMAIKALSCSEKPNDSDLISRQDAVNAIYHHLTGWTIDECRMMLHEVQSAQPELYCAPQPDLSDDGTLMMTVPHGILSDVKRVLVDEVGTKFCKTMYQDEPERKKGRWIKISPANIYECSECGKNVMTDDISAYDFCHGCGAEMEGDQNAD